MSDQLLAAREGRVLRLTLNREEKRNALSAELCTGLVEALESAREDARVGCVLVDAKGPVFCAGMDLAEATSAEAVAMTAVHERLFTVAMRSTVPIVAAVRGPAMGGGVGLIANAHIAIAAQGSNFAFSEVRIGMWPWVIFRSLVHAMGERRALALSLTGRVFSVQEALQFGLVHEVTPAIEVDDRATATAEHIASLSRETIRHALAFVHEARELPVSQALATALQYRASNLASPDFLEGVQAFQEKRKPLWPSNVE